MSCNVKQLIEINKAINEIAHIETKKEAAHGKEYTVKCRKLVLNFEFEHPQHGYGPDRLETTGLSDCFNDALCVVIARNTPSLLKETLVELNDMRREISAAAQEEFLTFLGETQP